MRSGAGASRRQRGSNHFAADTVWIATVGALDAFVRGSERRIDLAGVDGRVFVNNASLGVYAKFVQTADYGDATAETVARMVPAHQRASHLRRPQSQRHRPRTLSLSRCGARVVPHGSCAGATRSAALRLRFLGFEPMAHLLTVLACPLGSHSKWRNEATRPARARTERIAFWPRARR
jgi:hypothetical protein